MRPRPPVVRRGVSRPAISAGSGGRGETTARPAAYVTRRLPGGAVDVLARELDVRLWDDEDTPVPPGVLHEEAAAADGLLVMLTDPVGADLLAAASRLRVVSTMSVGFDHIDVAACTASGVLVCHTPGVLTETTADLAFALLLAAARRLPEAWRFITDGRWTTWSPRQLAGVDVHGRTLGIVGAGRIGSAVARRGRGFGMRLLYTGRGRKPEVERELGASFRDLDGLLREADFVSLHAPLDPSTRHLIGARELALMKPTAVLINTARGPLVDEAALAEALRLGTIRAAGLDVWEREPVSADHPLLSLPGVVALPHMGSATVATRERMASLAAENLLAALRGRRPPHPVNPEVLPPAPGPSAPHR